MSILAAVIIVLILCLIFILLIKNNLGKLKLKREYGEVIGARVNSWNIVSGRPAHYIIKVEYERDNKKENKTLITSRRFAKKYEYDKNIQVVIIPNSNKVFFEEEDWKVQNIIFFIFLLFLVSFLIQLLVACFVMLYQ